MPASIGVIFTVANHAAGSPLPGGPGPARAQPWATGLPSALTRVTHQRAAGVAGSGALRTRQGSRSRAPGPPASPGASDRPSHADAGMVRFTVPPSPPTHPVAAGVVPSGAAGPELGGAAGLVPGVSAGLVLGAAAAPVPDAGVPVPAPVPVGGFPEAAAAGGASGEAPAAGGGWAG